VRGQAAPLEQLPSARDAGHRKDGAPRAQHVLVATLTSCPAGKSRCQLHVASLLCSNAFSQRISFNYQCAAFMHKLLYGDEVQVADHLLPLPTLI